MPNENDGGFLRTAKSGGLYGALVVTGDGSASGGLTDTQLRATPVSTRESANTTATLTNVADTASSTTILASNANRRGASIYNDSTSTLYLKLGATASTTSFTVLMAAASYYEIPFGYTGIIDGIWSSDSTGSARVTEITA